MNVLVVAAHPDDEVLGCGGTIVRLSREGHQVFIAILGEGISSRCDKRENADPQALRGLQCKSRDVANLLGARELFMFGLPDNRFDTLPLLQVVKIIEGLIDQLKPEVIYTHHGGDLNIDHVIVHRATLTATRPLPGGPVRSVLTYEVASSTEWAFQNLGPCFRPNTFVEIQQTLEVKIRAMELYESEARRFPHPRSPEALRAISIRWGSVVGLPAAEAFELVRELR